MKSCSGPSRLSRHVLSLRKGYQIVKISQTWRIEFFEEEQYLWLLKKEELLKRCKNYLSTQNQQKGNSAIVMGVLEFEKDATSQRDGRRKSN
jgi:hypothetical protein